MAKTRISVYLIKQEYTDYESIVKTDACQNIQVVDGIGTLYSKMSYTKSPAWTREVFGNSIDATHLITASASAVFLVPYVMEDSERIFALTFGFGYTLLIQNSIEERFGLKTALNMADSNSLRKVSRTTVAGNALKADEQLPKKSSISDFTLDIQRDLLDGVTVAADDDGIFSGNVKGADSFSASVEINMQNIKEILAKLYSLYRSDSYKKSFDWIDRISYVKSSETEEALNALAVELIRQGSPDIWMAVPEIVNWEMVSGFSIAGSNETYPDILIGDVLSTLKEPLSSFDQLKKRKIRMVGSNAGDVLETWTADKCLFGELEYRGKQYCINGGKWYLIDSDFAAQINKAYDQTTTSSLPFPDCPNEMDEKEYNALLANEGGSTRALMDAKNITYGGGRSKVELCDVLTDQGCFIHVKHYSGSATLSHLFSQGLVSAELMKMDEGFRRKANEKLVEAAPDFGFDLTREGLQEVIFGIITKDTANRPNIPFFSKVTFDYVASHLKMMGINVSIKAIHKTAAE